MTHELKEWLAEAGCIALLLLTCLALGYAKHAHADITASNFSSGSVSGNPLLISSTAATGDTVLCVSLLNGASHTITSVSRNGHSLAVMSGVNHDSWAYSSFYCEANPSVGTYDISVAYTGGSGSFWYNYETMQGTDGSLPSNSSHTYSASDPMTATLSASAGNSALVHSFALSDSIAGRPAYNSGATRRSNCCNISSVGDSIGFASSGTQSFGILGNSGTIVYAVELIPGAASSTSSTTTSATSTSATDDNRDLFFWFVSFVAGMVFIIWVFKK